MVLCIFIYTKTYKLLEVIFIELAKSTLKELLKIFLILFIYILVLSIFNYFNILGNQTTNYLRIIGFLIILYFNGNSLKIRNSKNNILNSLLLSLSIVLIFFVILLIVRYKISFKLLIYDLLIIGVTLLGSFRKKKIAK